MTRQEAIDKVYGMSGTKEQHEALEFLIPEVHELREFYERQQEDERIRKQLIDAIKIGRSNSGISFTEEAASRYIAWLEKHSEEEIKKIRKDALIEWIKNKINFSDGGFVNGLLCLAYKDVIEHLNEM